MVRAKRIHWTRFHETRGSQLDYRELWDFLDRYSRQHRYGDYNEEAPISAEDLELVLANWGENPE